MADPSSVQRLRAVLRRAMSAPAAQLRRWDALVRIDAPDSVHQMRVASRSLRSIIQVLRPLLQSSEARAVERGLRDLGRLLGAARDAEVLQDLIAERAPDMPLELLRPRTAGRTVSWLLDDRAAAYRRAHSAVLDAFGSADHAGLLDRVDVFVSAVPLSDRTASALRSTGTTTAEHLIEPLLVGRLDMLLGMARRALAEQHPGARIELLHDVRKEAKRLRYAISAVTGEGGAVLGTDLADRARISTKIQNALGRHRDSAMLAEHLRVSALAQSDPHRSFVLGAMFAAELPRQAALEAKLARRLHELEDWADRA